jgi:hypothetical protein
MSSRFCTCEIKEFKPIEMNTYEKWPGGGIMLR